MALKHFLKRALLSGTLLSVPAVGLAQALPSDTTYHTKPFLLKAGLRLTHLAYTHNHQVWQFLLPLSVGAEYRLAPRFSLYSLAETDLLASHTANRRRAQTNTVSDAMFSLGIRYYYGRSATKSTAFSSPEFGKYLALDGSAEWQQLATVTALATRRRNTPAALTPALYARWGIQNRLRPHLLYDLNAGLGVLAPVHYYHSERESGTSHWNAGAQVNISVYFGY